MQVFEGNPGLGSGKVSGAEERRLMSQSGRRVQKEHAGDPGSTQQLRGRQHGADTGLCGPELREPTGGRQESRGQHSAVLVTPQPPPSFQATQVVCTGLPAGKGGSYQRNVTPAESPRPRGLGWSERIRDTWRHLAPPCLHPALLWTDRRFSPSPTARPSPVHGQPRPAQEGDTVFPALDADPLQ